ncbi:hypothetical protein GGS20DRAFT_597237 [Poronia punctata]|nr:hypothetical protein GGS20DRAFT_597237 [Poronia punctata]
MSASPDISNMPPSTPSLNLAIADMNRKRQTRLTLQKEFERLGNKIAQANNDDKERAKLEYEQTLVGIEMSKTEQDAIGLERALLLEEKERGMIPYKRFEKRVKEISARYLEAGSRQYHFLKKKARVDNPDPVKLTDEPSLGGALHSLCRKGDGLEKGCAGFALPKSWKKPSTKFYNTAGSGKYAASTWCQVTARWWPDEDVKMAHIVPHLLTGGNLEEVIFGNSGNLDLPGNSLMLSTKIQGWFDKYFLVIIPVDAAERHAIKRWKVEVVSEDITSAPLYPRENGEAGMVSGKDIHGKELTFRNEARPTGRCLYFHFIMALVRMKDLSRPGWQEIWAKYYTLRPFATPRPYMRRTMLLALAKHFETTDVKTIDSFLEGQGFEAPISLTPEETQEAARRVLMAVESSVTMAEVDEEGSHSNDEDSDSDNEEEG